MDDVFETFSQKDPVGYRNFLSNAEKISVSKTKLHTNEGVLVSDADFEVLLAYFNLVNKLTNNNYYDFENPSSITNNSTYVTNIENATFIEAIIYGAIIEACCKKIYGVFTAFLAKFGNSKLMTRIAMRFLEYSRVHNDVELYNEILSSSVAPMLIERYPNVINIASNNFKLDPNLGEQHYLRLANEFLSNMNNISLKWNLYNETLSISNIKDNPDILKLLKANVLNNDTDFTQSTTDEAFLLAALELSGTENG